MTSLSGPGVTARYAQVLLQAAEDTGLALPGELVERIRGADRLSLAETDELWEEWCSRSPDALAGLRLGSRVQAGHLDSAGILLVTCETLGEALAELAAYAPLIGEGGSFALRRVGPRAYVDFTHHFGVRPVARTEAAMATLLHLARWATGGRLRPAGMWFAHEPLAPFEEYARVLGVQPHFSAPVTSLGLGTDQLALPMVQANEALRNHVRQLADHTLAELEGPGYGAPGLGVQLQRLVRDHPTWGRDRVAAHLSLSGRHLNRRLGAEGLTFKAVRERTLQELALQWLREGHRVAAIASRLGYSDESTFTRAFRRWHGVTPSDFRARDERHPEG